MKPFEKKAIYTEKDFFELFCGFSSRKIRKSPKRNKFYLIKSSKEKLLRTALSYCFICNTREYCNGWIIEYQVVPAFSTIVLFVILPATLIQELYYFFALHSGSISYFFISVFANSLLFLISRKAKRDYLQEFESMF